MHVRWHLCEAWEVANFNQHTVQAMMYHTSQRETLGRKFAESRNVMLQSVVDWRQLPNKGKLNNRQPIFAVSVFS